ncbi:Inorganic phosphate transporter pho84 [Apophysomyces ossiformis]|uniref:Inorganic phosphate transporter pho84 n=1 Tax=Apophysomyces ossiformis TaxID=679940 RepID=A0A8H7BZE0_9FUNG|nr:Inorganic phosphate transporter pho84 [Apophysomyces ossiformis]
MSSQIHLREGIGLSQDSYIADVLERRRAVLEQIDSAEFGWFHIRACIVSGIGFFTDAYDIFAINLVSTMLGFVYWKEQGGHTPHAVETTLKVTCSIGTMFGQLVFGWLADRLGRKRMYGVELIIIIIGTVGQSFAGNGPAVAFWGIIAFWRVILGIGIGGDYPLSSVITAEFATTKRRGAMMAAVFAMQGFGQLAASVVGLIGTVAYQNAIREDPNYLDYVWRIVIGVGAVPALFALYYRLVLPETPRFTMDVEQKVEKGISDAQAFIDYGAAAGDYSDNIAVARINVSPHASWADFRAYFGQWKHFKVLFGCAYSWFALDVAWYGLGLNSSVILQKIGFAGGFDSSDVEGYAPYDAVFRVCVGNIIINLLGSIPGYWISVFTIDRLGRKTIQIMGFIMLTIFFIVLGFAYDAILKTSLPLFIVIYTLAQVFFNFGPNTTTFIVPGECFPTRYRSTAHGISAAAGKLGSIVAQVGFGLLKDIGGYNAWINHLLQIFALFMLSGIFSSLLIPETKGKTLEELSGERRRSTIEEERDSTPLQEYYQKGTY